MWPAPKALDYILGHRLVGSKRCKVVLSAARLGASPRYKYALACVQRKRERYRSVVGIVVSQSAEAFFGEEVWMASDGQVTLVPPCSVLEEHNGA
jgi:hypothetical protein